jgi:hypothetical protein
MTINTLGSLLCFLIWSLPFSINREPIRFTPTFVSTHQSSILSKIDLDFLKFFVKAVVVDKQNGAIGRNRENFISVGFQRYSSRFIAYGILTKNVELVAIGIKIMEFPLSEQQTDGSFKDNSPKSKGKSSASSVAFYLNDAGESLLLLKNSTWFQKSDETKSLRSQLEAMRPRISKSLTWLISQAPELIKGDGNGRATNRLWKDANAFYLTGKALDRQDAMELGEKFVQLCLEQQNPDGAFLEKKGFDSSYQGVSLLEALLHYTNLNPESDRAPIVWEAIQRAVKLELKFILPSGEIETKGNTRVFSGGETYFNKEKNVDYLALVRGLLYYHQLTQDATIKNAADLVFAFYTRKRR